MSDRSAGSLGSLSSLAPASQKSGPAVPDLSPNKLTSARYGDLMVGLLVAIGLAVLAGTATSGSDLPANTWGEIALVVVAAFLAGALIVRRVRVTGWAAVSLISFAALALLTALSISWSVTPDQSWLEAARTTAYLAAFASAVVLARLFPGRWTALLGAVGATAVILTGWALVIKVFTLGAGGQPQYGRLLAPFGYWNATGLMAGMGMPVLLWAASRRESGRLVRSLALPGLAVLGAVVILSYSRTALAATVVGLLVLVVFSRSRLRALLVLGLAVIGTAAISVWALGDSALTGDHVALAARQSADTTFGIVLVIAIGVLGAVGFAASLLVDRVTLSRRARHRVNLVLLGALALVPVAVVAALAASSRGLTGEVSHVWSTLTSSQTAVGDKASRLVDLANSRPRYWRQALSVTDHHLLAGSGAGSFGTAHLRYATATLTPSNAQHAHSYVFETLSDLGVVGLAVSLTLLVSWAAAALRTLSARTGTSEPERDGLWTLLAVVLAFGVSSSFDWTWFYPGLAVTALICAGWLAGRGAAPVATRAGSARMSRRPWSARPGTVAALTVLLVGAIAVVWATWEPLRSSNAANAGISAMTSGHAGQAIADAQAARSADPLSLEPLQELSALYDAVGDRALAREELVRATTLQPQNPLPWSWLGGYELQHGQPGPAVVALRRAAGLDITNAQVSQQLSRAEQASARATAQG